MLSLWSKTFRTSYNLLARAKLIIPAEPKHIHRWVAPTLREINRRRKAVGPEPEEPRSSYLEWNYDVEIRCFAKRVQEKFDENLLKEAFIQREWANLAEFKAKEKGDNLFVPFEHNHDLAQEGSKIITDTIKEVYAKSYTNDIVETVCTHLTSDEMLAHIAKYLGIKDLVKSAEFPPNTKTMADAFRAIVGALSHSTTSENVKSFVNDFVISQMNGKDIFDVWVPKEPYHYLLTLLKQKGIEEIEPRLCNQSATNTILANYQVGLYNVKNKSCIGLGWGETVEIAKDTAALNAIQRIYNIIN